MKQQYKILFLFLWCCVITAYFPKAQNLSQYKKGNLIIQLTEQAYKQTHIKESKNTGLRRLDELQKKYNALSIQPLYSIAPKNKVLDKRYGLSRVFLIKFPVDADIKFFAREYKSLQEVEIAEPNYIFRFSNPNPGQIKPASVLQKNYQSKKINNPTLFPNDPLYHLQWSHYNAGNTVIPYSGGGITGIADCDADIQEAWDITTGASDVIIAFIDSGIDWAHPEFTGRILPGWNFEDNSNDTQDTYGHGTITAGIAAASGNNGIGIAGVDWKCKIMPLSVFPDFANVTSVDKVVSAIQYAADNGANIINMSFGGSFVNESYPGILEGAVNYAYESGCALFAASGNDNHAAPEYPAAFTNVMAVGALSPCNERKERIVNGTGSCDKDTRVDYDTPWGSNYGYWLDIVAPGVILPSTDILGMKNGYSSFSDCNDPVPSFCLKPTPDGNYLKDVFGTSIASPFAAGVAALMLSVNPNLTPAQIYQVIKNTANDIEAPGVDLETGYGRINAFKAVQQAQVYGCAPFHIISTDIQESSLTYKAVNTVTADNSIYAGAGGIYKAGGSVYLKPGFEVKANGYHRSYIADCETGNFVKQTNSLPGDTFNKQKLSEQNTGENKKPSAAYPNPFTNKISIEYNLAENSRISCNIYDQYGKKVAAVLAGAHQYQGRHIIAWNTEKFAAGVYIYELITNNKKEIGRIIKVN